MDKNYNSAYTFAEESKVLEELEKKKFMDLEKSIKKATSEIDDKLNNIVKENKNQSEKLQLHIDLLKKESEESKKEAKLAKKWSVINFIITTILAIVSIIIAIVGI